VLFAGDAIENYLDGTPRDVLEKSVSDLAHESELRELGMATFLDRPLGIGKQAGQNDRTPLLTYEAFSASIARQRLAALAEQPGCSAAGGLLERWRDCQAMAHGYTGHQGRFPTRLGVPCLEDANLAASNFVFLRTTRSSLDEFLRHFDWRGLRATLPEDCAWLTQGRDVFLIRVAPCVPASGQPLMAAIDGSGAVRFYLHLAERRDDGVEGELIEYREEDGHEWPMGGLVVKRPAAGDSPAAEAATIAVPTALPAP
jgi:hypothetical protein